MSTFDDILKDSGMVKISFDDAEMIMDSDKEINDSVVEAINLLMNDIRFHMYINLILSMGEKDAEALAKDTVRIVCQFFYDKKYGNKDKNEN